MANYCWNHAHITGSKEALDAIEKAIERERGDGSLWFETFKKCIPNGYFDYTSNDTYSEFGSKWFDAQIERESDDTLIISGDSAWSPVSEFFRKISEAYKVDVESDYGEPGMDFGGWFDCSNGDVTRDDQTSWLRFIDASDKGRAFEYIQDDALNNTWDSYSEFINTYSRSGELDLFTQSQLDTIKEIIEEKK